MNSKLLVAVFLFIASPLVLAAQQGNENLTPQQLEGKGLFKQRCGVCHLSLVVGMVNGQAVMLTTNTYGPPLSKDVVNGREDEVRQQIMQGSNRMPGFQYGLKPAQIDAIISYLKTVEKTSQKGSSNASANPD